MKILDRYKEWKMRTRLKSIIVECVDCANSYDHLYGPLTNEKKDEILKTYKQKYVDAGSTEEQFGIDLLAHTII